MTKRGNLIKKLLPSLVFPMVILALGAYVFLASFSYEFITAAFAGAAGGILVTLSLALLVRDIRRGLAEAAPGLDSVPTQEKHRMHPLIIALAWCAGLFLAILLIGFLLAIPLWVLTFLLRHRASLVYTFITPAVLWLIMKFGVEGGLGTLFFKGILFGGRPPSLW